MVLSACHTKRCVFFSIMLPVALSEKELNKPNLFSALCLCECKIAFDPTNPGFNWWPSFLP